MNNQLDIFGKLGEYFRPDFRFNGPDYVPERDNPRLGRQIQKVYDLMKDGRWRSLADIAGLISEPEASISAQLRHLRKERFGGHTVNRRHEVNGLYHYQLIINDGK